MVKLEDVARAAGVSIGTVSNLLNGRAGRMGKETRERVERAIAETGFQPNRAARLLKTGHTPMLGLLVPSITNPHYGVLARAVETAAQANHGFRMVLGSTYRDPQLEASFLDDLLSHGVRGVILGSSLNNEDHLRSAIRRGLVALSYDRRQTHGDAPGVDHLSVDHVSADNVEAGRLAATHLIGQGHRRLAFAMPGGMTMSRKAKIDGMMAAAKAAGVTAQVAVGSSLIGYGDNDLGEIGRALAHDIAQMQPRPTGLIAVNDMLAIGLLAGLSDCGLRVPQDISVVGYDDTRMASLVRPALSSVRLPIGEMAATMVQRVVQRLTESAMPAAEFLFQPTLVARTSSGPVPSTN